jgi:hypothetical protein
MSGPMSLRAPDITVEADGRADSTTVLKSRHVFQYKKTMKKDGSAKIPSPYNSFVKEG